MDEETNSDSLKEGTDFVVREGNSSPYELEAFINFLLSHRLIEGYPHEKILGGHFPIVVKLTKGYSSPLAPYFLGTLYSLDCFTLDLQRSWGRFQVEIFVIVAFLQIWLWEHFKNYSLVPKILNSFKTSFPSSQGLPQSRGWNKVVVSSNSFLCKVLDGSTNWAARPYSPLESELTSLFHSLKNEIVSCYKNAHWSMEELSFVAYAFTSYL